MHAQSTFEVLTKSGADGSHRWQGALIRLFRLCRELTESLNADIRAGMLPKQFCARSSFEKHSTFGEVKNDVQCVADNYPLKVHSPFEGVATIFGGIWNASDLGDRNASDALLKLRFMAGTMDLPMHSHDHSDRVIFAADGAGVFEFATDGRSAREITSTEVKAGDILVFARGTVHSFKVPSTDLVLLSYHSPFIDLDDPQQYTIASEAQRSVH